jgi:hypothetical protein
MKPCSRLADYFVTPGAIFVDPLLSSAPHKNQSGCLRVFSTSLFSGVRRLAAAPTVPRSSAGFAPNATSFR